MELQYFFGRIPAAGSTLVVPECGLGRRRFSGLCSLVAFTIAMSVYALYLNPDAADTLAAMADA